MDEALKKITSELEAQFRAFLEQPETKAVIEETQKAAEKDTGTFEVVITSENLDRYQEVIKLDGWELEHYRNNPVVLWGHDHKQLPIGIATEIVVRDGKMIAKGKFAPHAYAQEIRKLYDMGMMRATSVGFIEKEREGNLITKAELLEFSFVSVPANPFALSTLVKSGLSVNEMVTKGFVFVEKEAEAPVEEPADEPDDDDDDDEEDVEPPAEVDERSLQEVLAALLPDQRMKFKTYIQNLKDAIAALEDLAEKDQEPEGNEAPEETEEEKQLREFSAKRKVLQDASTILGEVLAEARQAVEAQK